MNKNIIDVKSLGDTISQIRKLQGLSQEDLAGITGTGRRFISDLEKGKETSQIGKIFQILGALGITIHLSNQWK